MSRRGAIAERIQSSFLTYIVYSYSGLAAPTARRVVDEIGETSDMASFTRQEALDYHRRGRPGKIQIADGMSTEDFADIICGQLG